MRKKGFKSNVPQNASDFLEGGLLPDALPPKLVWTPPFDLDLAWGPAKGHLLTDSYKDLVRSSCPQSCWQGCSSPQRSQLIPTPTSCSWFPLLTYITPVI